MNDSELEGAIAELSEQLERMPNNGLLVPSSRNVLAAVEARLPLSNEVRDFYHHANPVNVRIPWMVEWISLFSIEDLEGGQEGYRFVCGHREKPAIGWRPEWIVVGEASGDPIIVDTASVSAPVLMARHGMGSWGPAQVSPSLAAFVQVLARWLSYRLARGPNLRESLLLSTSRRVAPRPRGC